MNKIAADRLLSDVFSATAIAMDVSPWPDAGLTVNQVAPLFVDHPHSLAMDTVAVTRVADDGNDDGNPDSATEHRIGSGLVMSVTLVPPQPM